MSSSRRFTGPIGGLLALLLGGFALGMQASAQSLDYGMYEQLFDEPVTDSATGKPQRASEAPANIEIITQDDIRRSGAVTIPDVLQFIAGVDVRSYGIADAEVGIRGYNQAYNPRLLVLVNGRQVYSDDYGHVEWPTIPVQLDEIRQIEVIKGPNSALYGFNAVSGVINIITYDPLHDSINVATLRGGTQDYRSGSVVGTGQIGDAAGVRLSLGGFRASDFAPGNLAPAEAVSRLSPMAGVFNLDARVKFGAGVEGFFEASDADTRYAEENFTDAFDTQSKQTNSFRAGVNADTSIGLLSFSAYRNAESVSIYAPTIADLPTWGTEAVIVVQASDLVKVGAEHSLRIGLEYRNNAATSPGAIQGTIGYQVYAASAMWDWQIAPALSLTNAVRVDTLRLSYSGTLAPGSELTMADYNNAGFTVPSFNSGLVFAVTDRDTLRLMLARGVQVPSLIDFGWQIPASQDSPVVTVGNPGLRPSIVYNAELDYDRAVPAIDSTLRAALFAQRTDDLISEPYAATPVIGPAGLPVLQSANVGSSDAIGVELGIKGHAASGFRWNASYAFVSTTDHTTLDTGPLTTNPVDYAQAVPRHVVILGLGYSHGAWEADVMGRWQSSYRDYQATGTGPYLQPVEIDNYVTLNARIGYRVTDHLLLSMVAQQFNAPSLIQTAGPPVERRLIGMVTIRF
jgi:iron complex outermembrane receptor protein